MSDIGKTLDDRGTQYGKYLDQAKVAVGIKHAMETGRNWTRLEADQREALDMIAVKMARILNGNPDNHDSWFDIVGYAKLVADRLEPK